MSRLRARIQRQEMEEEQRRIVDIALAGGSAPHAARSSEADPLRLRGIPAIGIGVAGEIPGTRPDRAVMRRPRRPLN